MVLQASFSTAANLEKSIAKASTAGFLIVASVPLPVSFASCNIFFRNNVSVPYLLCMSRLCCSTLSCCQRRISKLCLA